MEATKVPSKELDRCLHEESLTSSFHMTTTCNEIQVEGDVEDAPLELEEGVRSTVDDLKEINLGTKYDPWPTYISALLTPEEEIAYIELLHEYRDVFVWSYKEMPRLDPRVVVHHLVVKHGV